METHTIEVTGIPDDLMELLDERIRQKGGNRADYIRELLQKELLGGPLPSQEDSAPHPAMTFEEILAPVHRHVAESGSTDEEMDDLFEEVREQVRKERRASRRS